MDSISTEDIWNLQNVLPFLITCALMSLPMSSRSLTVDVWPFMAASISGEIPSLLPVLRKTVQQHIKVTNVHFLLPVLNILKPFHSPGVDVGTSSEQLLDDVDVAPGGSQWKRSVVRDIPVFKVCPFGQQQLHHLVRQVNVHGYTYTCTVHMYNVQVPVSSVCECRLEWAHSPAAKTHAQLRMVGHTSACTYILGRQTSSLHHQPPASLQSRLRRERCPSYGLTEPQCQHCGLAGWPQSLRAQHWLPGWEGCNPSCPGAQCLHREPEEVPPVHHGHLRGREGADGGSATLPQTTTWLQHSCLRL